MSYVSGCVFIYCSTLVAFYYQPSLSPLSSLSLIHQFSVNVPKVDYDRPENEGLPGTHNFYLQTEEHVKVGVW